MGKTGGVVPRRLRDLLTFSFSYCGACCLGFMIYRSGGRAHIASGCGNLKSSPYLLVVEGFDQYIVATLLQDIEPEIGVAQA
ncbi:MAG: hypothetical protein DMG57_34845 [Acidobacteria bacterium]|nr:MAG: hypothetical protein DMG57_34845 [Acidobacteriota bacterium]